MTNYKKRTATNHIVVHCAATTASMDIGRDEIDRWHRARGWFTIGYHYVIRRNGTVETGRPEDVVGAHVLNHNSDTIGICMAGGLASDKKTPQDNFTKEQLASLETLLRELKERYPKANIMGHSDFPEHKTRACPVFDLKAFLKVTQLDN
jgi:N-acetyl-anhydromuramyl-L-alanine amidase AmpD